LMPSTKGSLHCADNWEALQARNIKGNDGNPQV
jgi:hypothetical protein